MANTTSETASRDDALAAFDGTIHLVFSSHRNRERYEPFRKFRAKLVRNLDEVFDHLESGALPNDRRKALSLQRRNAATRTAPCRRQKPDAQQLRGENAQETSASVTPKPKAIATLNALLLVRVLAPAKAPLHIGNLPCCKYDNFIKL